MKKTMKYRKVTDFGTSTQKVAAVTRTGGYYYWNWKFPFRHLMKERIYITTNNAIYSLSEDIEA